MEAIPPTEPSARHYCASCGASRAAAEKFCECGAVRPDDGWAVGVPPPRLAGDDPAVLEGLGVAGARFLGEADGLVRYGGRVGAMNVEAWIGRHVPFAVLDAALEAAGRAEHPALLVPLDHGPLPGGDGWYVVLPPPLELDLERALGSGALAVDHALDLAAHLAEALWALQRAGRIHGGLRPADVGVRLGAAAGQRDVLQVPVVPLPPRRHRFLAPEALAGDPVPASDQVLVGLVLYAACTGRWPFDGPPDGPPPRMAERAPEVRVPVVVEQVAARLLATSPAARFRDLQAVVIELQAVRRTLELRVPPTPRPVKSVAPVFVARRRHVPVVWIGLGTGLVLALAVAVVGSSWPRSEPAPATVAPGVPMTAADLPLPVPVAMPAPPREEAPTEPLAAASRRPPGERVEAVAAPADVAAVVDPVEVPAAVEPEPVPTEPSPEPAAVAAPPPPVAPSPAVAPVGGRLVGERSGRPLVLELELRPDGTLRGWDEVTVGPRAFRRPLAGSWTRVAAGIAIDATETEGPRSVRYVGTLDAAGRGGGTWSDGGRASGEWQVAR